MSNVAISITRKIEVSGDLLSDMLFGFLEKAGLVRSTRPATWELTDLGQEWIRNQLREHADRGSERTSEAFVLEQAGFKLTKESTRLLSTR